jgi:hypothetical protein
MKHWVYNRIVTENFADLPTGAGFCNHAQYHLILMFRSSTKYQRVYNVVVLVIVGSMIECIADTVLMASWK